MTDEVYIQFADNRIGTELMIRKWQSTPFEDGEQYTRTSSITAKIEAAEKMAEALERGLKKMRMGYISDDEMGRLEKSLAHWNTVNGAAKERGGKL